MYKKGHWHYIFSNKKSPQANIAFHDTNMCYQTCVNGEMELDTKPAFPTKNLQRSTTSFLQKRKTPKMLQISLWLYEFALKWLVVQFQKFFHC